MRKLFTFLLAIAACVGASHAAPAVAVNGKLPGAFSVSATKKVCFSQGNLQYQASTKTWRFAENQYEAVGGSNGDNNVAPYNYTTSANHSPSASQTGWIDLFGWAASGISRTGVTAYQPYSTSRNDADYGTTSTKSAGETLGNYDWGKNMGDGWRTLTADEWGYLLGPGNGGTTPSGQRDNYQSLRGLCKITVGSTSYPGMIILPDDLYNNLPTEGDIATKWAACAVAAGSSLQYTNATFTEKEWTALQAAGAVFLPAAGYRGKTVQGAGVHGNYWSSSASSDVNAFYLNFFAGSLYPENGSHRYTGRSVRLVITTYAVTYDANGGEGEIALQRAYNGRDLTLSNGSGLSREGYVIDGWATSPDGEKVYNLGATYTADVDITLYAHWAQLYTITFNNYDGTQLQSGYVAEGEMPEYEGEEPTKSSTDAYSYTFTGWDPEIVAATADATYTAQFSEEPNQATVDAVKNLIDAICSPVEYTTACKEGIDEAREAYDALTDDQKALVDNYDDLLAAEAAYEDAKTAAATVIGDHNTENEINTYLTLNDGQEIQVLTIDRPVLNNMYNTLCLPFDMNEDQIAASSLNGIEIYELEDVSVVNDELYLYTGAQKNAIVAGRPYLVKFSDASQLDQLTFANVVVNNANLTEEAVTIKGVTFTGTFQPLVLGAQTELNFNGGHLFLAADNTLLWPNTNSALKPFRAYFTVNVDAGQAAGMPMRRGMPAHIGQPAQMPTGVESIQPSAVSSQKVMIDGVLYIIRGEHMYDAQGQMVK